MTLPKLQSHSRWPDWRDEDSPVVAGPVNEIAFEEVGSSNDETGSDAVGLAPLRPVPFGCFASTFVPRSF